MHTFSQNRTEIVIFVIGRESTWVAGTCGEGERADAKGGEAGQEEEAPRQGPQTHAIQSSLRHCCCWVWKEARTEFFREVNDEFGSMDGSMISFCRCWVATFSHFSVILRLMSL